jgi:hypothetical protein
MAKSVIPIGPYHPLQEEPEFFKLTVEGETVVDIDVNIGYNHRGIEKLSERKTFDQSTFVIERICGRGYYPCRGPTKSEIYKNNNSRGRTYTLTSAVAGTCGALSRL